MIVNDQKPAMSGNEHRYVLTLDCPDRVGIVAEISKFLADVGGWILEAAYHADPVSGWFHTRQAVLASSVDMSYDELKKRWIEMALSLIHI